MKKVLIGVCLLAALFIWGHCRIGWKNQQLCQL